MTKLSDRRPENLIKLDGGNRRRLTSEDRACGFHQGQSTRMLTNRPVIVTQSDLSSSATTLWCRGSPYSRGLRRARADGCTRAVLLARPQHLELCAGEFIHERQSLCRCFYHPSLMSPDWIKQVIRSNVRQRWNESFAQRPRGAGFHQDPWAIDRSRSEQNQHPF